MDPVTSRTSTTSVFTKFSEASHDTLIGRLLNPKIFMRTVGTVVVALMRMMPVSGFEISGSNAAVP